MKEYQKAIEAHVAARAADSERENLWQLPEFQSLMNTLWVSPLAILAIVAGFAGFFGLQGYREIKRNLQEEVAKTTQHLVALSLAGGYLGTALYTWELILDLLKPLAEKALIEAGTIPHADDRAGQDEYIANQIEKYIDDQIPLELIETRDAASAKAHLGLVKRLADDSITQLKSIPSGIDLTGARGWSKQLLELEAGQAYAYYIATDYKRSEAIEWEWALQYSQNAIDALDEDWIQRVLKSRFEEYAQNWVDTYLYVRLAYAHQHPSKAANAKRQARDYYGRKVSDNSLYQDVKKRFDGKF